MFQAAKQTKVFEDVVTQIQEAILDGRLKTGDTLPSERQLKDMFNISRGTLREALRVLSAEGLIRLIPNRGSYVTTPTFEEIKEMFDVMVVLEGVCARTAAEKMSDQEFLKLERLHQKLEKNFRLRDQKEYIRQNNLYHAFVQELAGNKTLNQIVHSCFDQWFYHFRRRVIKPLGNPGAVGPNQRMPFWSHTIGVAPLQYG